MFEAVCDFAVQGAAHAGCKQCKHPGNRKSSIQKHSKRNPCSCCPPDFVEEFETCEARPDEPCQSDFHTREAQRHIDKVTPQANFDLPDPCSAYPQRHIDKVSPQANQVPDHVLLIHTTLQCQHGSKM